MSKQTINIGASPNDGTGTPLRTSFDYTNQNFTELYTAVGPSGNNIVVPGTATITGDLTVDTSTLKVDSANDRVGVGTASPAQFVHLSKSNTSTALTAPPVGGASLRIQNTSSTNNNFGSVEFYNAAGLFGASVNCQYTNQATPTNDLVFVTRGSSGGLEHYRIAADGVCTWSEVGGVAGTAMTLNATGLGVGGTPSGNAPMILVQGAAGTYAKFNSTVGAKTWSTGYRSGTLQYEIQEDGVERFVIANGGNVGIGVTPSAWNASFRGIDISTGGAIAGSSDSVRLFSNSAFNTAGNNVYKNTATAGRYDIQGNVHTWYIAPSGTAGTAITDFATAKMTLDASGNLLVGTTSAEAKLTVLAGASGQSAIFKQPAQNFWCVLAHNQATSGDNSFVMFGTESTFTFRGSITYNRAGGLISYNTTSDYRAKDIIGPVVDSGSIVDSLKVYLGKMKGATIERPMLIAHEAQQVAPYAVTGTKDEVDTDGNPKYQQMDASALVPLLIAEIQSLRARVQTLETR